MNLLDVEMDNARNNLINALKAQVIDIKQIHNAFDALVDVFVIDNEDDFLDEVLLASKCAGFKDGGDDERWIWNDAMGWWEDNHA